LHGVLSWRVFGAEHTRRCAGKLAKNPSEMALIVKSQIGCNSAEWKARLGQQPGSATHADAIQVLTQRFAKLVSKDVAQINRMDAGRTSHLRQREIF